MIWAEFITFVRDIKSNNFDFRRDRGDIDCILNSLKKELTKLLSTKNGNQHTRKQTKEKKRNKVKYKLTK